MHSYHHYWSNWAHKYQKLRIQLPTITAAYLAEMWYCAIPYPPQATPDHPQPQENRHVLRAQPPLICNGKTHFPQADRMRRPFGRGECKGGRNCILKSPTWIWNFRAQALNNRMSRSAIGSDPRHNSLGTRLGASVRHFVPISKKQTILMLKLGCHGRHISCTSRFWLRPNKTNPNCSGRKIKCNGSRIKVSKNDKNVDMQLCI